MLTYNHERYVDQAVESVFAQKADFPIEVIIADDGSTDRTPKLIEAARAPEHITVRPVLRDRNIGMHANFADAWARCTGDAIAMLEGDDMWTDERKLADQLQLLAAHPAMTMCGGGARAVDANGNLRPEHWPDNFDEPVTLETLIEANVLQTCSLMYRAGVVTALPSWFGGLAMGDWPLNLLHAFRGDVGFLKRDVAAYRFHDGGVWSGRRRAYRLLASERALGAVEEHGDPSPGAAAALHRQRRALIAAALKDAIRRVDVADAGRAVATATRLARARTGDEQ